MLTITRVLTLAIAALLAACGGGGSDPLPSGFTTVAVGGRADVGQADVAVDLSGPTVSLDAPTTVLVEIDVEWQQSLMTPAALAFVVDVGNTLGTPHTVGMVSTAATRTSWTQSLVIQLPAGQTKLAGVAQVSASDAQGAALGALAYFDIKATWRVTPAQ